MVVDGMATALPFHRLIVRDPSFVEEPFRVHTRWIETEWDNTVPAFAGAAEPDTVEDRTTVVVEVGGKRLEVSLPASFAPVRPRRRPDPDGRLAPYPRQGRRGRGLR